MKNVKDDSEIIVDGKSNRLIFNNTIIYYKNKKAAIDSYKEIFKDHCYKFETSNSKPYIIDVGCNIGLSIAYFKKEYPESKIIGFDPDPYVYKFLKRNISVNKFTDITIKNIALADKNGDLPFYGELTGNDDDDRGNSLLESWGNRGFTNQIQVKTEILSKYINSEIDLLKLDVEGMEQRILEELGGKIDFVRNIALEVHETNQTKHRNSVESIKTILEQHNFCLRILNKDIQDFLPKRLKSWMGKVDPQLYSIQGINKNY